MTPIYIPSSRPEDWKQFLKQGDAHWKTGFSAKSLAYSWHDAAQTPLGIPPEIHAVLMTADEIGTVQPLLIVPEWVTQIAGKGELPHSDVFVLGKHSHGALVSITVEGKVDESFGKNNQTVAQWLQDGNVDNRRIRLDFLLARLSLAESNAQDIAYQLIQRTASAVVEAERFNAPVAVMIVHSFSLTQAHFAQFRTFVNAFGQTADAGHLVKITEYNGIRVFVGWAQGDAYYLTLSSI